MNNKIILQNITLKGIENVPGVLDYDQRGLVLSHENDIVVTRSKVDEDFLAYLMELGYSFNSNNLIHSKNQIQTYDSIFKENYIIDSLKDKSIEYIDTYQLTSLESDFANKLGKRLYGNTMVAEKYGTKSGFRNLCIKENIPIVKGFQGLKNPDEILVAILNIKDSKKILLRLDEGVSGAGNFVIDYQEFLKLSNKARLEKIKEFLNKLPQRLDSSGLCVEEWIDDVTSSPSFQFEVLPNGEIITLSSHEQLLEGESKWFVGCKYPSISFNDKYIDAMYEGLRFMKALKDEGFIGHCGIDYILKDNQFYLVEANIRRQGTAYPREFVRRVFSGLENIQYIAQDIQDKKLIGKKFKDIRKLLENLLVLPNKKQFEGLLIFNTGALNLGGRFDVVGVSKEETKINEYLNEMKKRIENL